MSRCFIFGSLPVSELSEKPQKGDLIIAADRGYETVISLGLTPDLIVGDFDSLGKTPDEKNVVVLPVRKDMTDTGYAVECGFERGYADFVVYGAAGGLLDHTLGNIAIAHDIARRGGSALFIGGEESFTVLHNSIKEFSPRKSGRLSVFAIGGASKGVTLRGLDYEVEDLSIEPSSHIGVSNAFIGKLSRVSVKEGDLLVVWQT